MKALNDLKKEVESKKKEFTELLKKLEPIEKEYRLRLEGQKKRQIILLISVVGCIVGFSLYEVAETTAIILGFICSFIMLFMVFVVVEDLKDIPKLKVDVFLLKTKINSYRDDITSLESELTSRINGDLDQLNNFISQFKTELDRNEDGTIDVIQHDNEFMKIFKSNQDLILEMEKSENRDFIKKFIKLSNFLVEKERNLQSLFQRISDIDSLVAFDVFKSNLIEQIQFYNLFRLNSLQMISSFLDNDRITFYLLYEKFDKLGVWNTNFENLFLSKMDILSSNIDMLTAEIIHMSESINSSINQLISITEENTFSLSEKLSTIGSKLDVNNMLNTINTYQNYKTNNRLS